jgi:hypothetical protein
LLGKLFTSTRLTIIGFGVPLSTLNPNPRGSEVDEESTVYRGYTNPNVQSRSFKILQESLNYSEAPQGNNIELQDTRGFEIKDGY